MARRLLIAFITGALLLCSSAVFAKKKPVSKVAAISVEYAKAVELVNHRHWNAAIAGLTSVIDNPATPKDMLPFAYTNRGTCYANKKMPKRALEDLTKAVELKPDYTAAYYNRARILAMLNRHPAAVADLTKAIELTKEGTVKAIYYKNRGLSYGAMNDLEKAKADFKMAKEIDPSVKIPVHYKPLLKQ